LLALLCTALAGCGQSKPAAPKFHPFMRARVTVSK
jgi:hypothetical protein